MGRNLVAELTGVLHEVPPDSDDLAAGDDRGEEAHVLKLVLYAGALHSMEEGVPIDHSDLLTAWLAFDNSIEGIRVNYKPGDTHGFKPTVSGRLLSDGPYFRR